MDNEKFTYNEVMDLIVYDENGNYITKLNTLKNSTITIDDKGNALLMARDALIDMDLLHFVYGNMDKNLNDYDYFVHYILNKKITFNQNTLTKKCRLIATSPIRELNSGKDAIVYYQIPSATIVSPFLYGFREEGTSVFDLCFKIHANEQGDLFHISY